MTYTMVGEWSGSDKNTGQTFEWILFTTALAEDVDIYVIGGKWPKELQRSLSHEKGLTLLGLLLSI